MHYSYLGIYGGEGGIRTLQESEAIETTGHIDTNPLSHNDLRHFLLVRLSLRSLAETRR